MYKLDDLISAFPEAPPRQPGAPSALQGIRVLDFSHFIAGPFATMLMADFGADVIKVEPPGRGDEFRNYPPMDPAYPGLGSPFFFANRNKRSVTLDLKHEGARKLVHELIQVSDVLVENFSTGVMKRLGLDYETCHALNPRLIYCSVPAYSRHGEFADRSGFDTVAQAESGLISLNGYPDRDGVRAPVPVMDMGTALMLCNTALAALMARASTGRGQYCEVALFDSAFAMMGYAPMQSLFADHEPERDGSLSADTSPSALFRASDGAFYINAGNDNIFLRLAHQVLERPDLVEDPRFRTRSHRMEHRHALLRCLGDIFAQKPLAYWSERFRAAGVPSGEVRSLAQALRSPEARARGLVTRVRHPVVGWVPNITPPPRLSDTPVAQPVPAPSLGQHTDEVLEQVLGYDARARAELRAQGVFGETP